MSKASAPCAATEYSFVPSLQTGDIVAGQYEVKGVIAYGGLGWVYLGWDTLLPRWVVLKGLLNTKDAISAQAAVAERQFLAAVKHPNIVGVYNFVSEGSEGYIVMEYVGGKSLKELRKERGPLPVAEAIAYIHRILLAFGYLHRAGMVYCDFKPDNFMVEDDDVKLIDMGGVRRADDLDGDVYGTKGYSAPEASDAPSFVSDLFTVGRTLAVLICEFAFQGKYQFSLPDAAEQPILARYESLHRFLRKATHTDPDHRFQTAEEMASQLVGVLREIVAEKETPRLMESLLFTPEGEGGGDPDRLDWRALPSARPDPQDPATAAILTAATLTDIDQVADLFERAEAQYPESIEAPLLLARSRIDQGRYADAETQIAQVESVDPFDWQVHWLRGVSALAQGQPKAALKHFDRVYSEAPGELAAQLALAYAAEAAGDNAEAARRYDTVSRTDPTFVTASFGLARSRRPDRAGAVAAYRRIPPTSRSYALAQVALARALMADRPGLAELEQASQTLEGVKLDEAAHHRLATELLRAAVARTESKEVSPDPAVKLLGTPMVARELRFALERELRACAHFEPIPAEKIALVDAANRERPRTWV